MAESVEVARAQYESGWSSEAEVLRMEQELAKMNNMRSELEQMEPASRAALNAALNRPQDAPIEAPQSRRVIAPKAQARLVNLLEPPCRRLVSVLPSASLCWSWFSSVDAEEEDDGG